MVLITSYNYSYWGINQLTSLGPHCWYQRSFISETEAKPSPQFTLGLVNVPFRDFEHFEYHFRHGQS